MKPPQRLMIAAAAFLSVGAVLADPSEAADAATGGQPLRASGEVAFETREVARAKAVASIAVSPDGLWLYGVTLFGEVLRWSVNPADGALGTLETFAPAAFQDADGPRGLVGLAVDPVDPSVLWVSDNYPIALWGTVEDRPEFSGRVSRIRLSADGAFTGDVETYIDGLPRSCGDHVTNSLRFRANPDAGSGDPAFLLYVSQGSNSASGKADRSWCYRPERLLSAAILEIDPTREPPEGGFDVRTEPIPPGGGNRRFGYSVRLGPLLWGLDDDALKTEAISIDGGPHDGDYLRFAVDGVATVRAGREPDSEVVATFYDPFADDAPVRLFATGVRNAYDLVWHGNGRLYVAVNGPSGGGATPDDPATAVDEGVEKAGRTPDYLLRLARGDYGGHPNPLRDEFVMHGGNPTPGEDPNEVDYYPVGVAPDPRYRPEQAYALGHHWSPNGMIEYRSEAGGALDGALVVVNYSKGNNLRAFLMDEDGAVREDMFLQDPTGTEITYVNPLDLALAPQGRIYLSTLNRSNGVSQIVLLDPPRRD